MPKASQSLPRRESICNLLFFLRQITRWIIHVTVCILTSILRKRVFSSASSSSLPSPTKMAECCRALWTRSEWPTQTNFWFMRKGQPAFTFRPRRRYEWRSDVVVFFFQRPASKGRHGPELGNTLQPAASVVFFWFPHKSAKRLRTHVQTGTQKNTG